jgi:hypothetical protein
MPRRERGLFAFTDSQNLLGPTGSLLKATTWPQAAALPVRIARSGRFANRFSPPFAIPAAEFMPFVGPRPKAAPVPARQTRHHRHA